MHTYDDDDEIEKMTVEEDNSTFLKTISNDKLYSGLIFGIGFLGLQILAYFLSLIPNITDSVLTFTVYLICTIVVLVLILLNSKIRKKISAHSFSDIKILISFTVGACVSFFFINFIVGVVQQFIFNLLNVSGSANDNQTSLEEMFKSDTLSAVLLIFSTCIFAPILEELTYRAALIGLFPKKFKYLGYTVASILFALIHTNFISDTPVIELVNMLSYLAAGFTLGFIYIRTENILPSIIGVVMILGGSQ